MRCLIYQTANDRLHNVSVGISALLWRQPETETGLAHGPGGMFRAYVDDAMERRKVLLRWGFEPAWVGHDGLQLLGKGPWPWVSVDRAPASRIFAHPIRYQRCLIPADALYVADVRGGWLSGPRQSSMFLAGLWDQGTFALLTVDAPSHLRTAVATRMPMALPPELFECWLSPMVTRLEALEEVIASRRTDWIPVEAAPAIADAFVSHLRPR